MDPKSESSSEQFNPFPDKKADDKLTASDPPAGPASDDFESSIGRKISRFLWIAVIVGGGLAVLLLIAVAAAPKLKGAFAPKKPKAVAAAPAVPAPTEPAEGDDALAPAPDEETLVLNCTYGANGAVTCSGTLGQPLDEIVEWLPGEEQPPAPEPAKARLTVTGPDGTTYRSSDVVAINEGSPGDLGSVRFVLASANP